MRIIAGSRRGTKLAGLGAAGGRPTTELTRKVIFDVIGDLIRNATVLDIYAGSGSLGIEALSRGAVGVTFVESNRDALTVLRKNLAKAGFMSQTEVLGMSAERALRALSKASAKFDYIFADPPYHQSLTRATLMAVESNDLLTRQGWVIVEHDRRDELIRSSGQLELVKTKEQGDTVVTFYRYV